MNKNTAAAATPTDVRAFFAENPNLIPDGVKGLGPNADGRGRLHGKAVEVFTAKTGREVGKAVKSASPAKEIEVSYRHHQPSGRTVAKKMMLTRAAMRDLGVQVPERGRLPESVREAVSEALSTQSADGAKRTAEARGKAASQPVKAADAPVAEVPAE